MGSDKRIFSKSTFCIALLLFSLISISPSHATLFGSGACQSDLTSTASVSVATSGNYCYFAFAATGPNSWKAPAGVNSFDAVIVAGGGAGGAGAWGGGGGAGGVVVYNGYSVSPGTVINLSVGAGGTPGADNLTPSTNRSNSGANSWIVSSSNVVAIGGGAGASYAYGATGDTYTTGTAGGSGGGGTEDVDNSKNAGGTSTQTLPTGATSKYGFRGGAGGTTTTRSGGGGGGAGALGSAAASSIGGNGGAGTNAVSSFLTVFATPFGVGGYIAGGGAGGSASATQATGGSGGGGNGGYNGNSPGISGTANTGSGGGGSTYSTNTTAGSGGSGLIILRFSPDVTAPSFTSATSFSLPENSAVSTTAATIKVSESATITISSGADVALFNISQSDSVTALIKFNVSPNYEAPADSGANNIYDLVISASDPSGNIGTQAITINVADVVDTSSVNSFTIGGTPRFRTQITITINVTVAAKVTFRVKNLRIPGCINVLATGSGSNFTATCPWRPSMRGNLALTAAVTPTGNGISSTSAGPLNVLVGNRVGLR